MLSKGVPARRTLQQRVQKGAQLLDEKQPGWYKRVNLKTLKLNECTNCVLGQLSGSYWKRQNIDVLPADEVIACNLPKTDVDSFLKLFVNYGFNTDEHLTVAEDNAIFEQLTSLWKKQINKRLTKDVGNTSTNKV